MQKKCKNINVRLPWWLTRKPCYLQFYFTSILCQLDTILDLGGDILVGFFSVFFHIVLQIPKWDNWDTFLILCLLVRRGLSKEIELIKKGINKVDWSCWSADVSAVQWLSHIGDIENSVIFETMKLKVSVIPVWHERP